MSDTHETPSEPTPPPADPAPPPQPADDDTPPAEITDDAKNMAMLAHLLGAILSVLGALIIWIIKKDDHPFIDQEGKEAVNFQLTIFFGYLLLIPISIITCGFGSFLYLPVFILALVLGIVAALKAKEGVAYKYPFAIRLIK
ncbi:MAG: DUF4870 domain-containing protein [Planctomycetota bacterium]